MRTLFTVQPSIGHLHPLVPVAEALTAAGHEVVVCSAPSFRADVEAFGLRHIDAGLDWMASDQSTWTAFPPMPPPGPEFAKFVVTIFADVTTAHMVPDLLDIARDFAPDLIIRESMEYGGCIAAEKLGIPHASVAGNAFSAIDSPEVHYFPGNRRMVTEPLNRHREAAGLPADPETLMPFRNLHLCFMPPSWDGTDAPAPPNSHYLRHTNTLEPGATLADWTKNLTGRPTVFASLGTVFNKTPGILEAIIEALGREDANAIVATGRDVAASRFGDIPDNVRLDPYLPQPLLLERCDAFITHGGFNSVKESLTAGVPMVVVPVTADQPYSAQRCAALGVARTIGPDDRTAGAISEALTAVLTEPAYRDNAMAFRAEMHSLPGQERIVGLLEKVANNAVTTAS